ncbi:general transcription factor II-I repeat domain-containing protein 2-like [Ixodes scapularis]|uniref:general transcription factor II-I repeat domain-containing protein 2-like n=1 Tax=Ixodes scapularis TaxID=6945 RepID=UPI001A9CF4C1|nr:general transcription factor II-I repeat domain-containing protein 2-like [Ixodes scapularis]
MTSNKKLKYKDEHRTFLPEWEEDFAFTDKNGKPLSLTCNAAISHHKASNVRRHYESNHKTCSRDCPASSELRKVKLAQLKSRLQNQQSLMKTFSKESDVAATASFSIAWNIARTKQAYLEGEFVKTNISDVVALFDPNNKDLQRRISQLSADVVDKLQEGLNSCKTFSLALDESTDIQDKPQLAIFVRYVSSDESVRKERLYMVALKETTRGVDIKNALLTTLELFGVPLQKLVAIATEGAPAMVGKNVGLVGLQSDPSIPDVLLIHCIICREHLLAKHFSHKDVINTVLRAVNYIR